MAASLAAAIAAVEGPELDAIARYTIPPRRHAPTAEPIRAAFEGFDYGHILEIARALASRYRCHQTHAEDAVQDGLLHLLVKRPDLYRENPGEWLGLLHYVSRFRLCEVKASRGRTVSIEALSEAAGDAPFNSARPCVPPSLDVDEECRYAPPPREGEAWNRTQIIGALQRYRDHHGHPPRLADCRSVNRLPSSATIYRHFDTFADAILAAGMVPSTLGRRRKRWTPIEAARACLGFRWRNGYWPSWADVRHNPGELPGTTVMLRYFGGTRSAEVQLGSEAILGLEGISG